MPPLVVPTVTPANAETAKRLALSVGAGDGRHEVAKLAGRLTPEERNGSRSCTGWTGTRWSCGKWLPRVAHHLPQKIDEDPLARVVNAAFARLRDEADRDDHHP